MRFIVALSVFVLGCSAMPAEPQLMSYDELTDLGYRSAFGLLTPEEEATINTVNARSDGATLKVDKLNKRWELCGAAPCGKPNYCCCTCCDKAFCTSCGCGNFPAGKCGAEYCPKQ